MSEDVGVPSPSETALAEAQENRLRATEVVALEFSTLGTVSQDAMFALAAAKITEILASAAVIGEPVNRPGQWDFDHWLAIKSDYESALRLCGERKINPTVVNALEQVLYEARASRQLPEALPTDNIGMVDTASASVNDLLNSGLVGDSQTAVNAEKGIQYCLDHLVPKEMRTPEDT